MMSRIWLGFMIMAACLSQPNDAQAQSIRSENTAGPRVIFTDYTKNFAKANTLPNQLSALAQVVDTDSDGVPDLTDACNNTPIGVVVDTNGRPRGDFDLDCDTDLVDLELFLAGYTGPMVPISNQPCNPIAQTGCLPGEKCTFMQDLLIPANLLTVCRANGTVPSGGACSSDPVTNVDDCVAGFFCSDNMCVEICSIAPNSCAGTQQCITLSSLVDSPGVGLCLASCDPLSTVPACPSGESCIVNLQLENAICSPLAGMATQGIDCQFLNSCASGYGCVLNNAPVNSTGLACAFICDASRSGGPTCLDGPGSTFRCAQINLFYANVANLPDTLGMCIDPVEWSIFDDDGDTILNFNDLCPNTPPGTPVDANGCPL